MAAVEVAMRRSLREGFVDVLVASLRPALARRDLEGQVNDVKSAFSSWDNCMAATYCKWPVIAVIIVGGLIALSVVWCIIRCACCGLSCCCSCFSCLKCCGNCCGCCDPPRGKRHKYLDEPYIPPNQGYKVQPPMNPHFPPVVPTMTPASTGVTTGVTPAYATTTSQYAEFDVSKPKPGGEDALPAMPVWEESSKKKVMLEEEEVEMDQLKKPEASGQNGVTAAGAIPNAVSPVGSPGLNRSPYGPPAGNPNTNGYYPTSGIETDPYAQNNQGYSQGSGGYGQAMNQPAGQGYGIAMAAGAGRQSPYTDAAYGQQQGGRGYGTPQQDSYNNYNTNQQQQGYGMPARRTPPNELAGDDGYAQPTARYGQGGARQSPSPQPNYGGGYGSNNAGYDSRGQYSTDSQRPLQPSTGGSPYRQYTRDAASPAPASNNTGDAAGFDFGTSAYSRPQQGYRQPSPVQPQQSSYPGQQQYGRSSPAQQQTGGYQGYKPYGGQQQQGGW